MRKNNIQYHWYGDNYTEKDILKGAEDVSSRQELMELAQEEDPLPTINWDRWDELVKQTKQHITKELKQHKPKIKSVYQYTKDGEFIKKWDSINECSANLGVWAQNITRCCHGRCKTCGGFKFSFNPI